MITTSTTSDKCIDYEALVGSEGTEFIRQAYLILLGRKPDASGRESSEAFLRRGGRKIDLIWSIVNSEEGRRYELALPGLRSALFRRSLERAPGLGRLLSPFLGLERAGRIHRRERAIMFAQAKSTELINLRLSHLEEKVTSASRKKSRAFPEALAGTTSVRAMSIMSELNKRIS